MTSATLSPNCSVKTTEAGVQLARDTNFRSGIVKWALVSEQLCTRVQERSDLSATKATTSHGIGLKVNTIADEMSSSSHLPKPTNKDWSCIDCNWLERSCAKHSATDIVVCIGSLWGLLMEALDHAACLLMWHCVKHLSCCSGYHSRAGVKSRSPHTPESADV